MQILFAVKIFLISNQHLHFIFSLKSQLISLKMSQGNVDIDSPTLEGQEFCDFIANLQRN